MTIPHQYDTWRKSSYSGGQTNCVEVALDPQTARVRDSKDPDQGHITVPSQAWSALIEQL